MGIGALVMWGFLAFTGRATTALTLNGTQWLWIAFTALFLLGYVWTWYSALKVAPASLVTSLLTVGAIVTILLTALVNGQMATSSQVAAFALLVFGAVLLVLPSKAWWYRKSEVA
jgi:uncharacterized membrane protein